MTEATGEVAVRSLRDPGRLVRVRRSQFTPIWVATLVLFAIGALLAPSSISSSALLAMLPYAAILVIAAAGQTLVIQHRGIDLSVGGSISVAAVIVTAYPAGSGHKVVVGILLAIAATTFAGTLAGLVVALLRIPALVVTLAANAILLGFVYSISNGFSSQAAGSLHRVVSDRTLGIPNTALIAIVVITVLSILIGHTVAGRRFVLAGGGPIQAYLAGIPVVRYEVGAYALAGTCYGLAGVLIGAFLQTPGLLVGQTYLLPTVAAVILGGTAVTGGAGSVVATAVAAVFVTQLNQLVVLAGAQTSVQLIVAGAIVAAGMALRSPPITGRMGALLAARSRSTPDPPNPKVTQTLTPPGDSRGEKDVA